VGILPYSLLTKLQNEESAQPKHTVPQKQSDTVFVEPLLQRASVFVFSRLCAGVSVDCSVEKICMKRLWNAPARVFDKRSHESIRRSLNAPRGRKRRKIAGKQSFFFSWAGGALNRLSRPRTTPASPCYPPNRRKYAPASLLVLSTTTFSAN